MCRSHADGGRRCSRANPTRSWRTQVSERLARNRRVAAGSEGERAEHLDDLVQRDEALLERINEAVERYGECVSPHHVPLPPAVERVVEGLRGQGMRAVLVGGSVRDSLVDGRAPKDLDFEIYPEDRGDGTSLTMDGVARAASRYGKVDEVGKSFGVLKMRLADGSDLDLSLPRRDNKAAAGHKGFVVEVDSNLTVEEAAARRDFTINALSYDPALGTLIDPHHGQADLEGRQLRHVSGAFSEDPLRVLRGAQFASRYDMSMDPQTVALCRSLRTEGATLSVERVRDEWGKFYSKGTHPGRGLTVLRQTGWDATHPGLAQVNDRALATTMGRMQKVLDRDGVSGADRIPPMAAVAAARMDNLTARAFLNRTVEGGKEQSRAYNMSRESSLPVTTVDARRLAWEGKVSIRERSRVAEAQGRGREAAQALSVAEKAGVADAPEPDLLDGRDVMAVDARKPGPWLGEVITSAREAQIRGDFRDRPSALTWLNRRFGPA